MATIIIIIIVLAYSFHNSIIINVMYGVHVDVFTVRSRYDLKFHSFLAILAVNFIVE